MPQYEFFCYSCNRPFSKTLTSAEYKEGTVTYPECGSKEVEQRWFYAAADRRSA